MNTSLMLHTVFWDVIHVSSIYTCCCRWLVMKALYFQDGDKIDHRLVEINRPILRVPNLAIHLNREMGTKFEWNKESHLLVVVAPFTHLHFNEMMCNCLIHVSV